MKWTEYSVQNVNKENKRYPKNLLSLGSPPKTLYYRGEPNSSLLKKSIAIVGSRKMTRYGASAIDKIVPSIVYAGITTISGYMYGVDTDVHTKTVESGGKTIAVLGCGINQPYPPENDKLYTKILQNDGIVLSELSPETKPKLWTFPERNRIIAALSTIGVLVIEAGVKSGSMITVNYARKLKKKIFAVPGPITSSVSEGTNYLIKNGIAQMVTDVGDILGHTAEYKKKEKSSMAMDNLENKIVDFLKNEELTIDELSLKLGINISEVGTKLSLMALKGIVIEAAGKYYIK